MAQVEGITVRLKPLPTRNTAMTHVGLSMPGELMRHGKILKSPSALLAKPFAD